MRRWREHIAWLHYKQRAHSRVRDQQLYFTSHINGPFFVCLQGLQSKRKVVVAWQNVKSSDLLEWQPLVDFDKSALYLQAELHGNKHNKQLASSLGVKELPCLQVRLLVLFFNFSFLFCFQCDVILLEALIFEWKSCCKFCILLLLPSLTMGTTYLNPHTYPWVSWWVE